MERTINKINRKPTDICLLCNQNKANKKNSHIVSAPLLTNVIGERDKEHSFVFSPDFIDEYYGSAYPQDYTTEVKNRNFTYDYILCNHCETYFSNIENIVIPILKSIDKVEIKRVKDIEYYEFTDKNSSIIRLFYFSIIWRLIIADYIEQGSFMNDIINTEKELRKVLLEFNKKTIKELRNIDLSDRFFLKIVTTEQDYYPISQLFNPFSDNPFVFIAGRFILFLFDTAQQANEKNIVFFQKGNPLLNYDNENFKIIIFPKSNYNELIKKQFEVFLSQFNKNEILNLKKDIDEKIKRIKI